MKTIGKRGFLKGCLIAFSWLFFASVIMAAPAPQGVLKQGIHWDNAADWLDPATCSYAVSAHLPLYLMHDALLKPMPGNIYAPCLAESYTVSPDQKVYEFRLRKGVKFHNGDTLTAEDVEFSFWRYKAAFAKQIQSRTEKVEVVNPLTVRIRFKDPYPDFLEHMLPGVSTIGWIVPKKYVEKVGDAGFKKQPVGAGPYKFVEFVPGVRLVAEAFEGYWRKTPSIKRVEIYTVTDLATRTAMLKRGEVDVITNLGGVSYEDVKKDPKLKLIPVPSPTRHFLQMTMQWDPKSPWSDPRVRKAASLAIDRQTLADIHMPGGGPAGEIGLPDMDPLAQRYPADPYDPGQAKKLLAEAGYPNGFQGGKYYPFDSGYWAYGEQIATYLRAVGISVDIVLLDRVAWYANREAGKFAGGIFNDPPMAPTIGGRLAYMFGKNPYGNYPDIQSLWEQFQKESAPARRKELLGRIQDLIREKTMFITLTTNTAPCGLNPRVKGDPHRIPPIIWFTAPFEDIELQ